MSSTFSDLCMDDSDFFSDEEFPSKLQFISPRNRDTENQRFHCMSQGLHLCMQLNGEWQSVGIALALQCSR